MASSSSTAEFEGLSSSFIDWLTQNSTTISPKIQLADLRSQNAGRGVLAKQEIDEDEELFSIPRSAILTAETSTLSLPADEMPEDPWLSLIVTMLYEFQQGASSKWKPYFDVLPLSFDTLMYWTPLELQALEGSSIVSKIGKSSADATFTAQILPLIRRHPTLFPLSTTLSNAEILDLSHRMGSTIMAYAFDLESPTSTSQPEETEQQEEWEEDSEADERILPKGMVPLADMLNADGDKNNARLFYDADRVVMKAICPIPSGAEIYNDYGPLPRADLLRRYGYISSTHALYDVVEIESEFIRQIAVQFPTTFVKEKEAAERIQYLREQDLYEESFDIGRSGSENEVFADELCVLVNTLALSSKDFELSRKMNRIPKPKLSPSARSLLYTVLVRRAAMYPPAKGKVSETLAVDERSQRRAQMARAVVDGELEVLREAADSASDIVVAQAGGPKRKINSFEENLAEFRRESKKVKK